MEKYRDLAFYDTDDEVTCTVYFKNLEWVKNRGMKGSRNIWALLGTHYDMDDHYKIEPFDISYFVIGFIVSKPQAPVVQILQQDGGDAEEDGEDEDTMCAGLGGYQDMVFVNIMSWNKLFL